MPTAICPVCRNGTLEPGHCAPPDYLSEDELDRYAEECEHAPPDFFECGYCSHREDY
ncbi:hypothetical protein [Arenibaculum sp.]|jgi:hypothetical protein|uniref:hypothetical protein n=1 Tax=Arenibaculum sp. TaxID=2865862 RepID=UPI002E10F71C|nr:hypothetical protein [Arenibaculum sp.]